MQSTRGANIELLRIIAISFVVILHISIHAQKGETATHDFVVSITITGVNLFVLISGYFGIKLRWRSLLNICNILIFYYIITTFGNYILFGRDITYKHLINIFTPMSRSEWWFAECYLMLMLISPALNIILRTKEKNKYFLFQGVMLYLCCISGFLLQNKVNTTGYTLINFILIYSIGDAIKKYDVASKFSYKTFALIYTIATIGIFFGFFKDFGRAHLYNNPFIIIAAIALFLIFAKIKLHSNTINKFATYTFPIYLIQDSSIGREFYKILYKIGAPCNFIGKEYLIKVILYIIGLITCAFICEITRRFFFEKAIIRVSNKLVQKFNLFSEKQ